MASLVAKIGLDHGRFSVGTGGAEVRGGMGYGGHARIGAPHNILVYEK